MAKPLGDSLKPGALGLLPEGIVSVGAIDDLAQQHECRVVCEVVLLEDRFEGALLPVVPQFDALHIVGRRPLPRGDLQHLVCRDIQELGLRINEFFNQPGTRYAIYLHTLTGDPLHRRFPSSSSVTIYTPAWHVAGRNT